ncbi:hypothetical protein ABUD21_001018 [Listeria monocytogenes]
MRAIEFRAWDKEVKEMDYNPSVIEIWQNKPINEQFRLESEEKLVWMQYTGLKDKNGNKIFEGDIVTAFSNINKYTDSFAGDVEPTFCFTSIVCDGACFKTTYKGEPSYVLNQNVSSLVKHMEVIGNIHENPELLEGTE